MRLSVKCRYYEVSDCAPEDKFCDRTRAAAVQQDGFALCKASDELRGDREVVLAAVQKDGKALEYASTS